MSIKKIVRAVLAAVIMVLFCGCDLWMNDWKGYLDYWSEAVTMGRVEVSGATFQTNDAGVQTLPLDATAKISGYVINPQGHALVENSIEINDLTLANSATKNVADPTLISVLLQNVASQGIKEHTTFTVTFAPVRADTNIASTETMSVTLQYNTPPAAPLRMNSDGNGGFEVVQAGGTWNADNDGNLYWKWPYTITSDTEPNAVNWFSIDGVLYELRECEVPNNSGIYSKNTGNKSVKLAAVDSEGISGSSITSGVTVPAGEVIVCKVTFDDGNGTSLNGPFTVVYGHELPTVTPPSRTGYTFGGYFTAQNGGGIQYYDENGAGVKSWDESNDTTLYAKWTANSYTITFNTTDGTGGSGTVTATYDKLLPKISLPQWTVTSTNPTYGFAGYNTKRDGTGTTYYNESGTPVEIWKETQDVTLYAQWKITKITLDASKINSADDLRIELAKYSGCEITVDLRGKDFSVNYDDFTKYREFFTVKDGNKVTITGGAIKVVGDFSSSSTSDDFFLFYVSGAGSSLTLSDYTLSASGVNFGSAGMTAVKVSSGSVNLINTTISDIASNGSGAGVFVSNGSVTMNGGAIKNNKARYGAAVYLSGGTFTMENGDIRYNECGNGSVISGDGSFVWNGGIISGNTNGSAEGRGVFGKDIKYGGTKNKNDAS
ncbi:MAG: InlB B-repeat-containing protein [Treponema sp.]|nr:InlB B-repeat-containing protein [Treponema sp.]